MLVQTYLDEWETIDPDDYTIHDSQFNIILYHKFTHEYGLILHPKYNGIQTMEELQVRCDLENHQLKDTSPCSQ